MGPLNKAVTPPPWSFFERIEVLKDYSADRRSCSSSMRRLSAITVVRRMKKATNRAKSELAAPAERLNHVYDY